MTGCCAGLRGCGSDRGGDGACGADRGTRQKPTCPVGWYLLSRRRALHLRRGAERRAEAISGAGRKHTDTQQKQRIRSRRTRQQYIYRYGAPVLLRARRFYTVLTAQAARCPFFRSAAICCASAGFCGRPAGAAGVKNPPRPFTGPGGQRLYYGPFLLRICCAR